MTETQQTRTRSIEIGGHFSRTASEGSGARQFLCLHGLVDDLSIWDRLATPLAERGRIVRYDQRGHGECGQSAKADASAQSDASAKSDGAAQSDGSAAPAGPYSREDLAADAVALMDALEIDRAILIGHSMGGVVAMATALAHSKRVAGLVLIGTASHCNEKTADWYEKIARAGESDGCAGLARAIYGPKAKRSVAGDAQGISHVTRMLKTLHSDPLTDRLAALACPALLLVGEKDPMGPRASEHIAAAMPAGAATLEVVPGCGHWIHREAPDVVLRALDHWLAACAL